jgi:hypothetical protein
METRLRQLRWREIEVVDEDLGRSVITRLQSGDFSWCQVRCVEVVVSSRVCDFTLQTNKLDQFAKRVLLELIEQIVNQA